MNNLVDLLYIRNKIKREICKLKIFVNIYGNKLWFIETCFFTNWNIKICYKCFCFEDKLSTIFYLLWIKIKSVYFAIKSDKFFYAKYCEW